MLSLFFYFFFFNDTATTEIYTLSLHDAFRSTFFPKTLQEVSANSPVRLIVRHSVWGNRVQNGESCFWCLRFRNCGGVSNSCAERGRYADQLFVKQCYRRSCGSGGTRNRTRRFGPDCPRRCVAL